MKMQPLTTGASMERAGIMGAAMKALEREDMGACTMMVTHHRGEMNALSTALLVFKIAAPSLKPMH